ncbi:hypothetical protein ABCS02_09410 [Microbacterium sp. X-17]|uniref:hypothetical protein n=1 Tax=Microbacterium sp. X-17 TaxID=3144404 RepID=UPI0031F4F3EA
MSKRGVLWIAFAAVHILVAVLGFIEPNGPMGDVYLVYEKWSGCALLPTSTYCGDPPTWSIPGITDSWVYPQLALAPMLLAWLFAWLISYTPAWAVLIILIDIPVFAVLVGRGASKGRRAAAWFWLAFILFLGPVGMYRIEGVTLPLAILGCLWLVRRPWVASILLAIATWMKVWPAALLGAALIAGRRRLPIIGGALIVTGLTLAVIFALGGGHNAFGFVGDQTTRGLQIEAPISSLYLWGAAFAVPGWWVYYSVDVLTFQVTGPNIDVVIALMTPLMGLAMLAVIVLGAYKAWRGATFARLFPTLSLALVLAFIVFNKVGSPQYIAWIAAPVVLGIVVQRERWLRPGAFVLAIALVTQLIYPLTYGGLMRRVNLDLLSVSLLTIRNVLLVVLLVWMVVRLVRVPETGRGPRLLRSLQRPASETASAPLAGAGAVASAPAAVVSPPESTPATP